MKSGALAAGLTLFTVLIGGCNGGGGGSSAGNAPAPSAPSPSLTYGIKQLQFTWPAVSGADFYRLYENADGASGFTQVGSDITATAVDHTIALHRRVNARYILAACNSVGCTDSSPLFPAANLLPAIGYVKASDTLFGDRFGRAIALSNDGTTLAVGAPTEDGSTSGVGGNQGDSSAPDAGAVYLFARDANGLWTQQAYIKASNTGSGDRFGTTVSLSDDGDTLAVGATGEASSATGIGADQTDNAAVASGAVYLFTRSGGAWSQQAYIKASNTDTSDSFGDALALSGDGTTLAVGAFGEDSSTTGINGDQADNAASAAGAVYLYTLDAGVWSQQAYIKASNANSNDWFGGRLALSNDGATLAVGAKLESSSATGINGNQGNNSATQAGAVYVFTRTAGVWSQQAYVKASNTEAGDFFGASLALSGDGDILAVGAEREDSAASGVGGDASDNSALWAGAAYLYSRDTGGLWSQQAYLKASNPEESDKFGGGLALSDDGTTLAVGAPGEASSAGGIDGDQSDNTSASVGAAYVFGFSAGSWSQQAYVKPSLSTGQITFGSALALSADGDTLAVGGPDESGNATGVGGDPSDIGGFAAGAAYLY